MADKSLSTTTVLPNFISEVFCEALPTANWGLRLTKDIRAGKDKKGTVIFSFWREHEGSADQLKFSLPDYAKAKINFVELKSRTEALAGQYNTSFVSNYQLISRLLTGAGNASVYETGLTLHPVYGIPYLPASTIKGVTRKRYIDNHHDGDEAIALGNQSFCDLFGCTGLTRLVQTDVEGKEKKKDVNSYYHKGRDLGDRKGWLIFFDAFPATAPKLEVDILTPHYKPYYEDAEPPADIYNPVPVTFLTVAPGVTFTVAVALRPPGNDGNTQSKELLAKVQEALHGAFTEDGVGAKTTVGYGRFVDPEEEKQRAAVQEAEDKRHKEEERQAAEQRKVEEERAKRGISQATAADYVSLKSLKPKRGLYKVAVQVVKKISSKGAGGMYVFTPLITELRGKNSGQVFINLELHPGEKIEGAEITSVNLNKGTFNLVQASIQKNK
jgi:CRISPR type III-B/RAMP module RAMP protein Cmr6